jgi:hypothetical protein
LERRREHLSGAQVWRFLQSLTKRRIPSPLCQPDFLRLLIDHESTLSRLAQKFSDQTAPQQEQTHPMVGTPSDLDVEENWRQVGMCSTLSLFGQNEDGRLRAADQISLEFSVDP